MEYLNLFFAFDAVGMIDINDKNVINSNQQHIRSLLIKPPHLDVLEIKSGGNDFCCSISLFDDILYMLVLYSECRKVSPEFMLRKLYRD